MLLDTAIEAFAGDDDEVTGVVLKDGRRIEARVATICTLPPHQLRRFSRPAWIARHPTWRQEGD